MKRIEDSLRDLWDNIKHANVRIIGDPKEEEKKKGTEKIFQEIIVENFPNLGKEKSQSSPGSAESPIQDKSKEKHTKTHINQTIKNEIQRKNSKSSKGKTTNNIQGNPHKVNS